MGKRKCVELLRSWVRLSVSFSFVWVFDDIMIHDSSQVSCQLTCFLFTFFVLRYNWQLKNWKVV